MKMPAPAFDRPYVSAKWGRSGVSAVKNVVSTATTTLTSTSNRRMSPTLAARWCATVSADEQRHAAHESRSDRARALRRGRAEDGRELPQARCGRVLRRCHLPPRDQGLHDPGWRPYG